MDDNTLSALRTQLVRLIINQGTIFSNWIKFAITVQGEVQLARVGRPGPQVIGIDEIAIRKGHTYRIVVSDLLRGRPIWFGGDDRKWPKITHTTSRRGLFFSPPGDCGLFQGHN